MLADTVTCGTCVAGSSSAFPTTFATSTLAFTGSNPGGNSVAFWNNPSDDLVNGSHTSNIGYLLTDSGGFTGTPSVIGTDTVATEFTGAGGGDPTAFNFVRNATAYNVSLLYANSSLDTGNNPANFAGAQIGYYIGSTMTALYNVGLTTSPTGTMAFNPGVSGTAYGFYETVCYSTPTSGPCTNYETYTTGAGNSGTNTGGAAWNHFALFQLASGAYVIGFTGQNGLYGENIGDFQDTVIELSLAPEPGTIAIMGLGLAALCVLGRRRFARK
jgi:hypothetical protein